MQQHPNLGWLFYKDYFANRLGDRTPLGDRLDWRFILTQNDDAREANKALLEKKNQRLIASTLPAQRVRALLDLQRQNAFPQDRLQTFQLVTTYPGLLLGSGYAHEGHIEGELKLGFYFDHTTGLPILPGSSVKGVLRSVFPDSDVAGREIRMAYLAWLIEEANADPRLRLDPIPVQPAHFRALEAQIFEGRSLPDEKGKAQWGPPARRDIFLDAYISAADDAGQFLATDYITPHINRKNAELSPFTNPVPIHFLKLRPGVTLCFQFSLQDSVLPDGTTVKALHKQVLFETILRIQGIGAKTNVGYGQFAPPAHVLQPGTSPASHLPPPPSEAAVFTGTIANGASLQAKIVNKEKKIARIFFPGNPDPIPLEVPISGNLPAAGTVVKAAIAEVHKGQIRSLRQTGLFSA